MLTGRAAHANGQRVVEFKTIDARDIDTATRVLSIVYGKNVHVDAHGDRRNFTMLSQVASFGEVIINKAEIASWSLSLETDEFIVLTVPLDGVLQYRSGARQYDNRPGQHIAVGRPFEKVTWCVTLGRGIALTIPVSGIIERASRLTGKTYNESLISQMSDRIDATATVAATLVRSLKTSLGEIASLNSIGMGKLASTGYQELLLNLAVVCLFPSVSATIGLDAKDCGPAVIRRARDYIREHAAEPIDLLQLAGELGISMRTMQEKFQRYYGFSPRDYILECRLVNARQRLLSPSAGMTVTGVALESGFGDLSQFASKYRIKYGELPSETLRVAHWLLA